MTDAELETPATCPHPGGTREYAEWWAEHFAEVLPLWKARWKRESETRRECERGCYGHDFYTCDQRCLCGLARTDYDLPTDEQKWRDRENLTCPLTKGPIYYLDCFHSAALLGDEFPVNSYGPSTWAKLLWLQRKIGHHFDRTELVTETKGQGPLEEDYWPGSDRPH